LLRDRKSADARDPPEAGLRNGSNEGLLNPKPLGNESNAGVLALGLPIQTARKTRLREEGVAGGVVTCATARKTRLMREEGVAGGVGAGVAGCRGDTSLAWVCDMNATAQALRLDTTHFENPHGLNHQMHKSSALDMARLAVSIPHPPPQTPHALPPTSQPPTPTPSSNKTIWQVIALRNHIFREIIQSQSATRRIFNPKRGQCKPKP
jgi:hypothetical protein